MFSEDEFLPISLLQHFLYCPRRAALVYIEGIWNDNVFTAHGRNVHEHVHSAGVESRADLIITRGLLLRSDKLGVTGKADVVEFQRSKLTGNVEFSSASDLVKLERIEGLWRIFPVEYKSGRLRHEFGYEIQLCAQAMCLEEMLGVNVTEGAIYYGKTGRRLTVIFDLKMKSATENACQQLHFLMDKGETPGAKFEPKCVKCSLLDLCIPKAVSRKRSIKSYMEKISSSSGLNQS